MKPLNNNEHFARIMDAPNAKNYMYVDKYLSDIPIPARLIRNST